MSPDFDELVGADLDPAERERLRRAHDLLVAVGPPPELPPSLADPRPPKAEVIPFWNRRRNATIAVLAAALAALAFGGGYLFGHSGQGKFAEKATVVMRGTQAAPPGAVASIALGNKDDAGNWQMLVRVSNLNKLRPGGYYVLWLTRHHKPKAACGSFLVRSSDKTTEVRFTVPYKLKGYDGWVVTSQTRGDHEPGPVLLTTPV